MKYLLCIFLLSFPLLADELLINGGFEQDLSVGWTKYGDSQSWITISRGTGYHSDPDYEARIYQTTGGGSGMLYQNKDVSNIDNMNFRCQLKLYAYDNHSSAWAAAAIVVYYYKGTTQILGRTMWVYKSAGCPWTNSSIFHMYNITNQNWNHYEINLSQEIQNYLPGVNPDDITRIRICLLTQAYHC